jgi:hypothetical protein
MVCFVQNFDWIYRILDVFWIVFLGQFVQIFDELFSDLFAVEISVKKQKKKKKLKEKRYVNDGAFFDDEQVHSIEKDREFHIVFCQFLNGVFQLCESVKK